MIRVQKHPGSHRKQDAISTTTTTSTHEICPAFARKVNTVPIVRVRKSHTSYGQSQLFIPWPTFHIHHLLPNPRFVFVALPFGHIFPHLGGRKGDFLFSPVSNEQSRLTLHVIGNWHVQVQLLQSGDVKRF